MTEHEIKQICLEEESKTFTGWDFSYLDGRLIEENLPWDYRARLKEFLKPYTKLLDMGTGGGEFLLSLEHNYNLTSVTEGWQPNYELCMKKLAPLGINVRFWEGGERLPFEDESFDLVINRHEYYDLSEVRRVLKKGGHFITQQVGSANGERLTKILAPDFEKDFYTFNLENEVPRFRQAGFKVVYKNQYYPSYKFMDIGALAYYARLIPWEFPGFSVEKNLPELIMIQKEIEERGCFDLTEHRFIIVSKKI